MEYFPVYFQGYRILVTPIQASELVRTKFGWKEKETEKEEKGRI